MAPTCMLSPKLPRCLVSGGYFKTFDESCSNCASIWRAWYLNHSLHPKMMNGADEHILEINILCVSISTNCNSTLQNCRVTAVDG